MQILQKELEKQGILLTDTQLQKFDIYMEMLIETNKEMNLTRITDKAEIQLRHFYDSLSPLFFGLIGQNASVIDVGTGAGFPGLPLKIARDDISVTLADSLSKRLEFLKRVTMATGVSSQIVHSRAEDLGQNKAFREKNDVCVSRAVAPLNVLAELTLPLVKVGGVCIFYKGKAAQDELDEAKFAIELLGGIYLKSFDYKLLDTAFSLIICEKMNKTPQKYPRKAGIPKKSPL